MIQVVGRASVASPRKIGAATSAARAAAEESPILRQFRHGSKANCLEIDWNLLVDTSWGLGAGLDDQGRQFVRRPSKAAAPSAIHRALLRGYQLRRTAPPSALAAPRSLF